MPTDFGPRFGHAQRKMYDALRDAGDVHVLDLYRIMRGEISPWPPRRTQQMIGYYATRLNRRIRSHGLAVKPGERKYTYRLVVL